MTSSPQEELYPGGGGACNKAGSIVVRFDKPTRGKEGVLPAHGSCWRAARVVFGKSSNFPNGVGTRTRSTRHLTRVVGSQNLTCFV